MKRIVNLIAVVVLALVLNTTALAQPQLVVVEKDPCIEPALMRITYYCDTGTMANGQQTRPKVVATNKVYMGMVAEVHRKNPDGTIGELVGLYEVCDTGAGLDINDDGKGESLRQLPIDHGGTGLMSIDFWFPNNEQGQAFLNEYGTELFVLFHIGQG